MPADIAAKARVHIADAIGVALAARRGLPVLDRVLEALGQGGGAGSSRLLGSRRTLPPIAAAFANSAAIHILDYEDIHDEARMHPTTVTLPAALAAAQLAGAQGRKLVEGVALANEVMCRLGLMWSPKGEGPASNWFLTQFFGYIAACIAAGIAMESSDDEIVSAIGLAYMQAAGGKEAGFGVGSDARAIYPAFGAMGGVHAALLARAGLIGPRTALDGDAGLFRVYFGVEPGAAAIAALLDPSPWAFADTDTKPWPCCRLSHPYVATAFAVRERVAGRPIERVRVAVNASAAKLCRPIEERRRPTTLQDAKYSILFMTAFALVHGRVTLDTLDAGALADARVLDLARRIEVAETLPDTVGHPPAQIEVDVPGETLRSPAFGDIRMSEARIRDKFVDCLTHVGHAPQAAALWDQLMCVDDLAVADLLAAIPEV
jgi:2-methylcitrate dehydratase PrpD